MKNPQANNYDAVSRYYDGVGRLVFAGALQRSQAYFLPRVPAQSRVLVVGGGTGKILEELAAVYADGLHITYVELSAKMLAQAQRRRVGNNRVEFVHAAIEEYASDGLFDVVITPFLFDNFLPEKAQTVHQKIDGMLGANGYWLYTDFVMSISPKIWQKLLLKSMYVFFGKMAKVETRQLTDMKPLFAKGYTTLEQQSFFAEFMESVLYRKDVALDKEA